MHSLKKIINEGGAAAVALTNKKLAPHPNNAERDLQYGKISDAELDSIFPREYGTMTDASDDTYVGRIFHALGSQGLIDTSHSPSYSMGSTRLAALKKYGRGSIGLDKYETDDVIATVSGKKTEYGDLDIDLLFTGDKKSIANAIEAIDPSVYAAAAGGPKAVAVAIRIGNKVIQVDLVDISEGQAAQDFLWKSSFVDLAAGVKGAFSIILLRAVASVMEIGPSDTLESLIQYAQDNPESRFAKDFNKKLKLNYQPVGSRFSLGSKGLKLIVDLEKPSKKDPNKKTQSKIDFEDAVRQGYEDLDELAQIILQNRNADSSTIYSATKLASFIKKHVPQSKINLIWSAFLKSTKDTLEGKIDQHDYETGMAFLGNLLGTEWTPEAAATLNEAREDIGRFIGKNKFSNKNMLLLLRALVSESGNEGKTSFDIKLSENPAVDMVEKMDSSFSHFGIDPEGKFFMETSNSGPVTKENLEEKFGTKPEFFHDIYESFKWLSNSKEVQGSLQEIFKQIGPIRYDAELFPVLTHEGDASGNIVFVGTPYSREKLGRVGGFVVFKAQKWSPEELSWYRPEPAENVALVKMIKQSSFSGNWAGDWRVYTNEEDMKHNVTLHVEFDELLSSYLSSEESFNKALALVSTRKNNPDKDELLFSLNRIREVLQDKLNSYASGAESILGGEGSYIEGVVLRVKKNNGDIFEAKGTSYKFDEHKEELWEDRVNVLNLTKTFEKKLMIEVLELRTDHPATLNKAIKQVSLEFNATSSGDEAKVEFIRELLPVITDKTTGFDKIKPETINLINETEALYKELLQQFEANKPNLDPDTIRKTQALYDSSAESLSKYKAAASSTLESMSYFVYLIGLTLNRRIDRFVNFGRTKPRPEKKDVPKVIFWNGRAQPWHKGHDAMVQKGKSMLNTLDAEAVMIMIVKGGKASQDKSVNPLSESDQINLISAIYENDPQVIVSDKILKRSFIGEIANVVYSTGYEVVGWLAGADRIDSYRKGLNSFNPEMWEKDHAYSPFDADDAGHSTVKMIETPRVMSGTKARELVNQVEVPEWIDAVAPDGIGEAAQQAYVEVYDKLRNPELSEIVFDALEEMSSAGGGAVSGYPGGFKDPDADEGTLIREEETDGDELLNTEVNEMDREVFMKEMQLRKFIRRAINIVESKNQKQRFLQESKVRKYVRKLILEAEEDHPHDSTGINVLEDLLKKIIPVFEKDYKSLTTDANQRKSFRSHVINAVQNSLAPSRAEISINPEAPQGPAVGMTEQEDELEMDIPTERDLDPKFIDIDPASKEAPEIAPEEKFGIPGEDETGRNVAMRSWDQVETSVIDAYNVLSNAQDREMFYDYLITNLKLYFDKMEEELSPGVQEPDSEIYQQQKTTEQPSSDFNI